MNIKAITTLITVVVKSVPEVKKFIFSDGKFNAQRAIVMLAFFVALAASVYFLGYEVTENTVELLDDVSDSIGYAE